MLLTSLWQELNIFLHECQFKWWRPLSAGVLITLIPPFYNLNQLSSLWSQRPKRLQSNFNEEHAGRLRLAEEWATVQRNTQITSDFVMGTFQETCWHVSLFHPGVRDLWYYCYWKPKYNCHYKLSVTVF